MKSYNNAIGVDIYEQPLETILTTANLSGKSTGLVTSVPIDHATPGAAASLVNRRAKYDGEFPDLDNILQQEFRIFLERGTNAAQTLADTVSELDPNRGDRLVGLYGARGQNGNLPVSSANGDYSTLDRFNVRSSFFMVLHGEG